MSSLPLGCIIPDDKPHVVAAPLADAPAGFPTNVPVVVGFNWYDSFDPENLKQYGRSWHAPDVEKGERLGNIRGGHCFCFEPMGAVRHNRQATRVFYDQGQEGACVGFGNSRAITIHKNDRAWFDGFWLYDEARRLEGTYPEGEGSTVHAGARVLLEKGHREQRGEHVCTREVGDEPPNPLDGITAIRWANSTDEVLRALARPNASAVPFVNSWGNNYPLVVWVPVATFDRLLSENGECGVFVEA